MLTKLAPARALAMVLLAAVILILALFFASGAALDANSPDSPAEEPPFIGAQPLLEKSNLQTNPVLGENWAQGAPDAQNNENRVQDEIGTENNAQAEYERMEMEAKETVSSRPARGFEGANVTIVEFSDFECPFTKKLNPTIDKLMSDYGGRVKRVYIHYPLRSIHPNAQLAAEASECAADQEKFWEFHDILFERGDLSLQSLNSYAQNLSLNMEKFSSCIDGGEKKKIIESHILLGSQNGVTNTPTFFINKKKITGIQPYGEFKEALDSALANN